MEHSIRHKHTANSTKTPNNKARKEINFQASSISTIKPQSCICATRVRETRVWFEEVMKCLWCVPHVCICVVVDGERRPSPLAAQLLQVLVFPFHSNSRRQLYNLGFFRRKVLLCTDNNFSIYRQSNWFRSLQAHSQPGTERQPFIHRHATCTENPVSHQLNLFLFNSLWHSININFREIDYY